MTWPEQKPPRFLSCAEAMPAENSALIVMIHVGIVGLGFMAATHIKAYRQIEGVKVAALCNPSGRHLDGDFSKVSGNVGDNAPLVLDMRGIKATKKFDDLLNDPAIEDRKSTRLNSSHSQISYAVFCLK